MYAGTLGRANDCLASNGFAMQRVRFAGITSNAAWPEHFDYVCFRGSAEADISLRIEGEDPSFRTPTTALSDHPAMYAILRVTPRRRPDIGTAH